MKQISLRFKKGATVHAKHILTDSEEKCNQILESIVSGEKVFEDAAKEFSTCLPDREAETLENSDEDRW